MSLLFFGCNMKKRLLCGCKLVTMPLQLTLL